MADKDADFSGVTNPKRVVEKRLEKAESDSGFDDKSKGSDAGELGKPWDDTFDGKTMSQSRFFKGKAIMNPSSGPPAAMLKKRASKD
jgi:hypothetical protein